MSEFTFIADQRSGSVELPPIATAQRNYNIEDPVYPLDDPTVYSEGFLSSSGKRVNPRTALYLPAVYQAVTRISSDVARSPLELYGETGGTYRALKDDPLFGLTAIQPNREMDAFKFWQRIMVHRLLWQNAYIFIARNARGEPAELLPLLPDRTEPRRRGGVLYYVTEVNGAEQDLAADRVLHIEGIGFDNLRALELTRLMRDAWGLALAQMDFAARVFRAGGRRGGVLEIPAAQTKTAADKLEEGFRKKYEDQGSWFTTIVLRDNAKFHEAQMTLRDSQSVEGREESTREVARAFNIRPGHLGVETSGVYGNKSDDTRDYLDMTLRPHMTGIAMQCRTKLLPIERQGRQCFEHNTDDLLQMSVKEQFDAYGEGVANLIITPNEARGKLGFAPHPDGDKLQNPNTQAPAEPAADETANAKQKPGGNPAGDDELNLALGEALARQVEAIVGVVGEKAQRAAAGGAKFVDWLDRKLPEERVRMTRALGPIAKCVAIARGNASFDPAALAYSGLQRDLQTIAAAKSEAELLPAVTAYFQHWSFQPCLDSTSKAA